MSDFRFRTGLALLMASTVSWTMAAQAGSAVNARVDAYVAAWVDSTRANLATALGEAAVFDADWGRRVPANTLPDSLAAFRDVKLELERRSPGEGQKVILEWKASNSTTTWAYTDTLTFEGDKLLRVEWRGQPAGPDDLAWAERFIAARNSLDGETFRAFMDTAGRIVGRTLPAGGYTVDGFIDFMQGLKGTVYERTGTTPIFRAKDGHLYYAFRVRRNPGATLVSGRDHLVLEKGLVIRFEGVY